MTLIKRVGRYIAEITISWSLLIVTYYWGRWVFEEDVTISKQNLRIVPYPLRRPSWQQFVTWSYPFFFKPSPQKTKVVYNVGTKLGFSTTDQWEWFIFSGDCIGQWELSFVVQGFLNLFCKIFFGGKVLLLKGFLGVIL